MPWDLVVIDEAHRLRNVYKPENKTARILSDALTLPHKVLLTAMPLQNSLLELYGLVSFVDERVFGDLDSFRAQFGQLKDAATPRPFIPSSSNCNSIWPARFPMPC